MKYFKTQFIVLSALIAILVGAQSVGAALLVQQPSQGGTGTGVAPTLGQILLGNSSGTYTPTATSSLGISGSTFATTSISATSPLSWNTATANMSIALASSTANGYLSSTDWSTFNNKGTVSSIIFSSPLTGGTITTTGTVGISMASSTADGYLSSTDWSTFNNKGSGTVTEIIAGTGLTGGTITGSGTIALSTPVSIANGGTGTTTASGAFDALSPLTTLGDIIYHNGTGSTRLGGNTSATRMFLQSTGDGANATAPIWDIIPATGEITYYQNASSSLDVAGVYQQTTTPIGYVVATTTTGVTNNQLINTWVTPAGQPGISFIPQGQFDLHVHALQTTTVGAQSLQLVGQLWETDASGAEIAQIGSFSTSTVLTSSQAEYNNSFNTSEIYNFASTTSRIELKLYAVVTGAGTAPELTVYLGGAANTHMGLPGTVIDVTTLVPYQNAINDVDLGSQSITATNFNGKLIGTASTTALTNAGPLWVTGQTNLANASSTGGITASAFYGPLVGNADTASAVAVGGITGLGTGVATALAVNVGSAGAPVVNGGVLGTPSSGTVTNLTGTASININGTVGATTPSTGVFTTATTTTFNAIGISTMATTTMTRLGVASSTPSNAISVGAGSIVNTENTLATSTTMTVDWTAGNQQLIKIGTDATAITFSNYIAGQNLKMIVCNPPSGTAGALTFSTPVYWVNQTTPTQTTTANNCDVWSFLGTIATSTSPVIFGTMSPKF